MKEKSFSVDDDSQITIPIRNLLAIIFATGVAVMGYFDLIARISLLERQGAVTEREIELNSDFRTRWPRGELGSLPADAEQNIRLDFIYERVNAMNDDLEKLKNRASGCE